MTKFPSYYTKTDRQVAVATKLMTELKKIMPPQLLLEVVVHEGVAHVLIEDPLNSRSWRIPWHCSIQSTITKLLDPT